MGVKNRSSNFTLPPEVVSNQHCLVDVSDIFYFFCSGEGKGESEVQGRGGGGLRFLLKIPGGGSPGERRGRGARGREGVCGESGGGGVNIFFRG